MHAIEAEKRRAHLRLRLAQAEAEKEAGFPIAAPEAVSEPYRGDPGLQAALSLKKGLKSKAPELYSGDTQKWRTSTYGNAFERVLTQSIAQSQRIEEGQKAQEFIVKEASQARKVAAAIKRQMIADNKVNRAAKKA